MPDFPTHARVLRNHRAVSIDSSPEGDVIECRCGWFYTQAQHVEHQAEMWREACTVTTVDQLDALPADALVITVSSRIACQRARTPRRDWYSTALSSVMADDIGLPALLVWHPGWSA